MEGVPARGDLVLGERGPALKERVGMGGEGEGLRGAGCGGGEAEAEDEDEDVVPFFPSVSSLLFPLPSVDDTRGLGGDFTALLKAPIDDDEDDDDNDEEDEEDEEEDEEDDEEDVGGWERETGGGLAGGRERMEPKLGAELEREG